MADLSEQEEERLRRALKVIGDEAGSRNHVSEPQHRPIWRRRRGMMAGALAAAVVCVAVVAGIAGHGSSGESTDHDDTGGNSITIAQETACSRIVVVGRVVKLRPVPDAPKRATLTFAVQDWIKPAHGHKRFSVNIVDPRPTATKSWKPGTRMLLVVPRRHDGDVGAYRGDAIKLYRPDYERGASSHAKCPAHWRP